MSRVTHCDICGKEFGTGFLIEIKSQAVFDFSDVAADRFEYGSKDVCRDCYYKIKKMLNKFEGKSEE